VNPETPIAPRARPAVPEISLRAANRSVEIGLLQKEVDTLEVELVARPYTWENAPFPFAYDLCRKVVLRRGETVHVAMEVPRNEATGFQAMDFCDAFRVRVGVLSGEGDELLAEREASIDFSDPIILQLQTDDIDHWSYPFAAPGTEFQRSFTDRSGAQIGAYAYGPSSMLHGTVTVTNGLRDLGYLAEAKDETAPDNPTVAALVDGMIVANKKPTTDGTIAYSMWSGNAKAENVLSFTFPHPVTLVRITLAGGYKEKDSQNPEAATLEMDGKRLASGTNLVERFFEGSGNVVFSFAPRTGKQVKLRIPPNSGPLRNRGLALTEVRLEGWDGNAPTASQGELTVSLEDAFSGKTTDVLRKQVALAAGEWQQIPITVQLPPAETPNALRLQAHYNAVSTEAPVLVLRPPKPLLPNRALVPERCAELGFIVTQGYRQCFSLGTGTREHPPGWATPDDLIWAYSRQMKEVSRRARTQAARLYVTEGDMRHYAAPWRTFPDGTPFFDEATPNIVAAMKKHPHWKDSDVVHLGNSDRWETGPQIDTLHGWQDFVEFDRYLRSIGKPPLKGKTRAEITAEIHSEREDEWQSWQFGQYLHNLRTLRDGFAAQGKRLLITAQGCPAIAGAAGAEVAETIQGMSDDCTWGMAEGSQSLTTGRQLATLAHNPVWKVTTLMEYGFVSNTLNNHEWHAPVCTVEPLRRMYYDRAWRATIWNDGEYRSVYTAGYNENVGIPYQMSENDWVQWWQIEERHSLLTPQLPAGAGIVISTMRFADPAHLRFNADDIFSGSPDGVGLARVFQRLHEAGLSIPFAANATALEKWKGTAPLIVLNPEVFIEPEIATLERLQKQGVRMVAITEHMNLDSRLAHLFSAPETLIALDPRSLSPADARRLMPKLGRVLDVPLQFPEGVCGYGFSMSGMRFIVAEEWKNQGYVAQIRLRATQNATAARACGLNEHRALAVRRDGGDWLIEVPLRPGDAELIAVRES
jgi:hypothetical protein